MRVRATRLFAISGGGRRPATFVFDGAEAAYSMRIPANSTYTGPLIRVRRSNDNAELDILAVTTPDANGNRFLNTTALLAFTGANSAFVTTWYDQTAGGRDYTQTNRARQPRIVNAGVVDTFNGAPTLFLNLANPLMANATFATNINTVSAVFNVSASAISLATLVSSESGAPIIRRTSAPADGWRSATTNANDYANSVNSRINGALAPGTSGGLPSVVNPLATPTVATFFPLATAGPIAPTSLFNSPIASTRIFVGSCPEIVYFTTQISDAVRVPLEQSQGAAYGITVV